MALQNLRTCETCGFDRAEEGRDCPLCGGTAVTQVPSAAETLLSSGPPAALPNGRPLPTFPADGEVLAGRYRIVGVLGRGGMGEVYRVIETAGGGEFALKVLGREAARASGSIDRFRREIAALAKIRHEAVLPIVDSGVIDSGPFLVTPVIDGEDLRVLLRRNGPLSVRQATEIGTTLSEALAAVHAVGIVHRDVKPANVMIDRAGHLRLLDFGLARADGIDVERVTLTGEFVGTPAYMAPEQFDARRADVRSDIYSLGVVLFELLTGHPPFKAPTVMAMALKHLREAPPPPSVSRPDLPMWVDRLILRCLEKEPSRRFADAGQVALELRRAATGSRPRPTRLPGGDTVMVVEDEGSGWALLVGSAREKAGWTLGLALRFQARHYRLARVDAPTGPTGRWTYRFTRWTDGEVMRRLVDYDEGHAAP